MAAKLSISIVDPTLVEWAQKRAEDQATSVSAIVSDALKAARREQAWARYLEWAGPVGELTPELEAEIGLEIDGAPPAKKSEPRKKPTRKSRQ
ncbi:MAG: hypothetical protein KIT84_14315 [Labilithrix sp.]|nr:hypothetical protein [Labilithrix sp.]MCW5812196.1 hypothetical protein [Labilithrix sp.]